MRFKSKNLTMLLKQRIFFMEHIFAMVLVFIPGVWSGNWQVRVKSICAYRGSTVTIQCSYDYPTRHNVKNVVWHKGLWASRGFVLTPLTTPHFEYVGDKKHDCSLRINNIEQTDEGTYYFRFETYWDRFRSNPVYLSVEDLIASIKSPVVTEGEAVTLTCHSGCQTDIQFVWYREGQKVTQTHFIARREHAGRYTCALRGQEHFKSSSVSLNVQYAPSNVNLSISPSKDIKQGSAVVFHCSSEANPTVTSSGYSLYKDGNGVSFGPSHRISAVQPSDSGQYYCQACNNITRAGSKLFQSFKTSVNVMYPPTNISISADLREVIEGSDVNLTCHSIANPPAVGFIWYRGSSSSMVQVGSGPVLSLFSVEASSSGLYMCQASNSLGENNSTQLVLSVKSKYTATSFPILAGVGVSLLFAFVSALLLYWKKQKRKQDKTQELSEGDSSSAAIKTSDSIYANALMFQTPSSNDYSSSEEVFYTTVTIRPKKPSHRSRVQTTPEKENSVIYATVAESR